MLVQSFRAINKDKHNSVIIISHQERIMQLADDIIVISDGKVTRSGPKDEIFPELIGDIDGGCGFGAKAGEDCE